MVVRCNGSGSGDFNGGRLIMHGESGKSTANQQFSKTQKTVRELHFWTSTLCDAYGGKRAWPTWQELKAQAELD